MTTCETNVIEIVESHTELRTDQGIGGRVKLSSDAIWLETEDSSSYIVYIVTPASHHWVPFNRMAGYPS